MPSFALDFAEHRHGGEQTLDELTTDPLREVADKLRVIIWRAPISSAIAQAVHSVNLIWPDRLA
jgi:hypothetical protein